MSPSRKVRNARQSPKDTLKTKREKLFESNRCSNPRICNSVPAYLLRQNNHYFEPNSYPWHTNVEDGEELKGCLTVPTKSPFYDPEKEESYFDQVYTIKNILGSGSFGDVFKVLCKEDNCLYAVKLTYRPFTSFFDRAMKLREVQRLRELSNHPNIIQFVKAWEDKGRLHIQTELCKTSLSDLYRISLPSTDRLWDHLLDLVSAVDYIHDHHLIHLDIKPANVLLTDKLVCKLGDLGTMISLKTDQISTFEDGDNRYLAREILNDPPTTAADIFSLGMSIFEIATNIELPSNGEDWHHIREGIIPERYLSLLDPTIRRIILRMLSESPLSRPTSKQIIEDIEVNERYMRRRDELLNEPNGSSFVSRWTSSFWNVIRSPMNIISSIMNNETNHRKRKASIDQNEEGPTVRKIGRFTHGTPESSRFSTESDHDEEEDNKSVPVEDSPSRELNELKRKLEEQLLSDRKKRAKEQALIDSNRSPIYSFRTSIHENGASSAPIGKRQSNPNALSFDWTPPRPSDRVDDSDSNDGSSRKINRSPGRNLRALGSPRKRVLDFSILDEDRTENEDQDNQE